MLSLEQHLQSLAFTVFKRYEMKDSSKIKKAPSTKKNQKIRNQKKEPTVED